MTSRILSIFFLFFLSTAFVNQHNHKLLSICISQRLLGTASVYMRTCKTSAAVRLLEFILLSMYTQ